MIDTLNTFLLPDYAFSIDCCYLPIKFTIAPWNKRNLDTTCGGWIVLNKVWSYRDSQQDFSMSENLGV